nr:transposase [Streptomyces kebangsaanensis]
MEQMARVPDEGAVQQSVPAGLCPVLCDRVHLRHPNAAGDDLQAGVGQHGVRQDPFAEPSRFREFSCWPTRRADALCPAPGDDAATVTARRMREPVERLTTAGQWKGEDPDIPIVVDAGYDVPRLARLLEDPPVQVLGRMRSDRALRRTAPPHAPAAQVEDQVRLSGPARRR